MTDHLGYVMGGIADHEAMINSELGKSACDPPSEATG
jgi:hypothetical protein